jgi:hypothetical protein
VARNDGVAEFDIAVAMGCVLEHGMLRFFRRLAEGAFDDGVVLLNSRTLWRTHGADTEIVV